MTAILRIACAVSKLFLRQARRAADAFDVGNDGDPGHGRCINSERN
jgi:hypothetical protein